MVPPVQLPRTEPAAGAPEDGGCGRNPGARAGLRVRSRAVARVYVWDRTRRQRNSDDKMSPSLHAQHSCTQGVTLHAMTSRHVLARSRDQTRDRRNVCRSSHGVTTVITTDPPDEVVRRARLALVDALIIKYGDPAFERAISAAGLEWGVERFAYAAQPEREADMLADAVDAGARFAVANCEPNDGGGLGRRWRSRCRPPDDSRVPCTTPERPVVDLRRPSPRPLARRTICPRGRKRRNRRLDGDGLSEGVRPVRRPGVRCCLPRPELSRPPMRSRHPDVRCDWAAGSPRAGRRGEAAWRCLCRRT